jgi:hypothetical protein
MRHWVVMGGNPGVSEVTDARVQLNVWLRLDGGVESLVGMLVGDVLQLLSSGGALAKTALMAWDGRKWVRVKDVTSPAGARQLVAALGRVGMAGFEPSLICWRDGDPFYAPHGDEVWATVSARDGGLVNLKVIGPSRMGEKLLRFLGVLGEEAEFVAGGAWAPGERWPSWADRSWWVQPLPSPRVTGPLWLLVAPAEAHRKLMASEHARRLAIGFHELARGGAVWQLSVEAGGPAGSVLKEWEVLLEELRLMA